MIHARTSTLPIQFIFRTMGFFRSELFPLQYLLVFFFSFWNDWRACMYSFTYTHITATVEYFTKNFFHLQCLIRIELDGKLWFFIDANNMMHRTVIGFGLILLLRWLLTYFFCYPHPARHTLNSKTYQKKIISSDFSFCLGEAIYIIRLSDKLIVRIPLDRKWTLKRDTQKPFWFKHSQFGWSASLICN